MFESRFAFNAEKFLQIFKDQQNRPAVTGERAIDLVESVLRSLQRYNRAKRNQLGPRRARVEPAGQLLAALAHVPTKYVEPQRVRRGVRAFTGCANQRQKPLRFRERQRVFREAGFPRAREPFDQQRPAAPLTNVFQGLCEE